jgi:hypothetical protein
MSRMWTITRVANIVTDASCFDFSVGSPESPFVELVKGNLYRGDISILRQHGLNNHACIRPTCASSSSTKHYDWPQLFDSNMASGT